MKPSKIKDHQKYVANRIMRIRNSTDPITTQQELADYLHVEKSAISMWEHCNNMPNIAYLLEIARFFGMTLDEFLDLNYYDDIIWFKKAKKWEELDEETKFIKEFRNIFRSVNSEGKKLLREMGSFVKLKFKRNFERELKTKLAEEEAKNEKLADYYGQLDQTENKNKLLIEENEELKLKLGLFKVVKPEEDLFSPENKTLAKQGYMILSEISHKKIEERIKKKEELESQLEAEEKKETPSHKSGIFIEWDGNETFVPIDNKDDPTK